MARPIRNTQTYDLKNNGKIVYRGTTNDPKRRREEHKDAGKQFTEMLLTSRKMTNEGAKKKEEQALKTYRNRNKGKNPKYNKDNDG